MEVERKRAVSIYRFLAAFQFGSGFFLLFFAAYITAAIHGVQTGCPYYAGAFIAGLAVLVLSGFGGAVYYTGKHTRLEILIPTRVKPLVIIYLILSPCAMISCTVGVIITSIYGLCQSDICSYTVNTDFNFGMAVFVLILELLCLISTVLSIGICVYFSKCLGLDIGCLPNPIAGSVKIQPEHDEMQDAQDMYVLQKWRHSMENDVDFRKIAEYLEKTRKQESDDIS